MYLYILCINLPSLLCIKSIIFLGVAFYSGTGSSPQEVEAANWIKCIVEDTDPVVLPEQAYVVSQILEAIYESSKTGKPVFFE